jgi:hypothetical protein
MLITWQICSSPLPPALHLRHNVTLAGDMHYNFYMTIKQPNSRMCFICGLENPVGLHLHIYETEPGIVESTYVAPEHFQGL